MYLWPRFPMQRGSDTTFLLPTHMHHTPTRVIITPADDDCSKCTNTSDENVLVDDLFRSSEVVAQSQINKIPTCVEDFTREWIFFVMNQHQMRTFGRRLSNVGQFSVEMDSLKEGGSGSKDQIDKATIRKVKTSSQHVLSEAFNVIVDVPDPPKNEMEEEDEEEEEEEEEKSNKVIYLVD